MIILFALCMLIAVMFGILIGYNQGIKIRNLTQAPRVLGEDLLAKSVWCTCGHGLSMHRDITGPCHHTQFGVTGNWIGNCSCKVAVPDPERPNVITTPGELEL